MGDVASDSTRETFPTRVPTGASQFSSIATSQATPCANLVT